jgi:hypothetical protein
MFDSADIRHREKKGTMSPVSPALSMEFRFASRRLVAVAILWIHTRFASFS